MAKTACFHPRVSLARFCKSWLPVVLWMILIFGGSTQLGAPRNTSRFIGPFLRWFAPNIADKTIGSVQYGIRKTGHVTEYAVLALLFWRARRKTFSPDTPRWNWREAGFAILFSTLYAVTDEFHQYFVATRQGSVWDVLIDTSGAVLGMLLLWKIGRWLKYW